MELLSTLEDGGIDLACGGGVARRTRLLVVDGSRLMAWLVGAIAPQEVAIEYTDSFDQACRILTERPPDAVVIEVPPAELPWTALAELCLRHGPPIPFRCWSSTHEPLNAPVSARGRLALRRKPSHVAALREEIAALMHEVGAAGAADGGGSG